MASGIIARAIPTLAAAIALCAASSAHAQKFLPFIFPEEREIRVRDPSELPSTPIPKTPPPPTVSSITKLPERRISLDDSIRTALGNSEVVRVLAGETAVSTGSTIYDTAIVNNGVDEQNARFDPSVQANNSFNRIETPTAIANLVDPTRSDIQGLRQDNYDLALDVSKTTVSGGTFNFGVDTNPTRFQPGVFPLNPQNRSAAEFSFTQPLLQGGGRRVNLAPIVLARIDTERSYFQFKDSVQQLVRSTIDAYWTLVFARTDLWAREQQFKQAKFAYDFNVANRAVGRGDLGDVALSQVALADFRSAVIAAKANLLQREAAFRNLLGLPPYDDKQLVPTSPPELQRLEMDWQWLLVLAEENRPDLIELKLILEADEQRLLQSRNQALPSVDALALYRWNGLEGEVPAGDRLATRPGQFTDWTLAVNFSVPLGLRSERAMLRRQELILARDRANLQQRLHSAAHDIALNLRNLDQFYEQYGAFQDTRAAALTNLEVQFAEFRAGRTDFLNVFQAIVSWGNAVSNEAQSLLLYNSELADLEEATGTILESHQIRFVEERFCSIGPLGRLGRGRLYPRSLPPTPNDDRYKTGDKAAENIFDLSTPEDLQRKLRRRIEQRREEIRPLPRVAPDGLERKTDLP